MWKKEQKESKPNIMWVLPSRASSWALSEPLSFLEGRVVRASVYHELLLSEWRKCSKRTEIFSNTELGEISQCNILEEMRSYYDQKQYFHYDRKLLGNNLYISVQIYIEQLFFIRHRPGRYKRYRKERDMALVPLKFSGKHTVIKISC